jgi:uncharacterized protein
MQGRLQQTYKISRELGTNAYFQGDMALSQMPRLSELVLPDDAVIPVTFEFNYNSYKHAIIKGHYRALLSVECQRCLEPMDTTIEQDFELLIDAAEEDINSFQLDSVFSTDGYLDVFEVIEDELILALPIISMHKDINCNKFMQTSSLQESSAETNNPFAVLQSLKGND